MNPVLAIAAGLCFFTLGVHVLVGGRAIVEPLLGWRDVPFAQSTLLVVWHMTSWTLFCIGGLLAVAAWTDRREVGLAVACLSLGYAALFITVSQRLLAAAIRLPQWILFGALALLSGAGYARAPRPAVAVALLSLAGVHLLWAAGVRWPERDDRTLALAIIGRAQLPSRTACLGVGAVLLAMAATFLTGAPSALHRSIAAVFLARGVLGFVEPWFRSGIRGTPYALYSRYMYSPLALSLGLTALVAA